MSRLIWVSGFAALLWAWSAEAASWRLENTTLIQEYATRPSLWGGTIAYLSASGGAVRFYDGASSITVYSPALYNYEPANANGAVAWRNKQQSPSSNEILRWDGSVPITAQNVSASPGVLDSDLAAAGNGDLIWSENHTWLIHYDAAGSTTQPLGVRGEHPSVYVTSTGLVTYAFQDPDDEQVKYFDGTTLYVLGPGDPFGAHPSVWDGAVAWIGLGSAGNSFTVSEVFYWKNGQTVRVTDDDAVNGVPDSFPSVWNDILIWSRNGPWAPRLMLWDGSEVTALTTTDGTYPSFHNGQLAWDGVDAGGVEGVFLGDVRQVVGDCTGDAVVDLADYAALEACLTGPALPLTPGCECSDLDGGGTVDLGDFTIFQQVFDGP